MQMQIQRKRNLQYPRECQVMAHRLARKGKAKAQKATPNRDHKIVLPELYLMMVARTKNHWPGGIIMRG